MSESSQAAAMRINIRLADLQQELLSHVGTAELLKQRLLETDEKITQARQEIDALLEERQALPEDPATV